MLIARRKGTWGLTMLCVPVAPVLAACNRPGTPPSAAARLLCLGDGGRIDTIDPTFQWSEVHGAEYYIVEVNRVSTGRAVGGRLVEGTRYTPDQSLYLGERYECRITPGNDSGLGPESETAEFEVAADIRPGAPILIDLDTTLGDGEVARRSRIRLNWRSRGSEVPTQERSCDLSEDCEGYLVGGDFYQLEIEQGGGGLAMSTYVETFEIDPRFGWHLDLSDTEETEDWSLSPRLHIQCDSSYSWRVRQLRAEIRELADRPSEFPEPSVWAEGMANSSAWSETWVFHVRLRPTGSSLQTWPNEDAEISGGRLTWEPPTGAPAGTTYQYQISDLPNVTGEDFTTDETRSVDLNPDHYLSGLTLVTGERYFWRVRAASVLGNCGGPWSPVRSFIWAGPRIEGAAMPPPSPVCVEEPCAAPTPTLRPIWTPTVLPVQTGVIGTAVVCRTGPDEVYPPLLRLEEGQEVQLRARDHLLEWVEIEALEESVDPCWVEPEQLGMPQSVDLTHLPVSVGVVTPPPSGIEINFNADECSIERGACTTIRWQMRGATTVTVLGESVEPSEAQEVCPDETTGYVLEAENVIEEDSAFLEIEVTEPRDDLGCIEGPNDPCP